MAFIVLRCSVADTSLWPPERKTMPGTAAGTLLSMHSIVWRATSSTDACSGASLPEITMFGLSSVP